MKKIPIKYLSYFLFIIGLFFLINPNINITGAVIGSELNIQLTFSLILGLVFVILGIIIFVEAKEDRLEKIVLTSSINKNPPLLRITKEAVNNQDVQRELDHLMRELGKGNFEAGLGEIGHVRDTDVFYLRGDRGARLYYRKIKENNYEIVCKSSKGYNQDKALTTLGRIYRRRKN